MSNKKDTTRYISIHGDDEEGYTVMRYKYTPDKFYPNLDSITTDWSKPKIFDTLEEAILSVKETQ